MDTTLNNEETGLPTHSAVLDADRLHDAISSAIQHVSATLEQQAHQDQREVSDTQQKATQIFVHMLHDIMDRDRQNNSIILQFEKPIDHQNKLQERMFSTLFAMYSGSGSVTVKDSTVVFVDTEDGYDAVDFVTLITEYQNLAGYNQLDSPMTAVVPWRDATQDDYDDYRTAPQKVTEIVLLWLGSQDGALRRVIQGLTGILNDSWLPHSGSVRYNTQQLVSLHVAQSCTRAIRDTTGANTAPWAWRSPMFRYNMENRLLDAPALHQLIYECTGVEQNG